LNAQRTMSCRQTIKLVSALSAAAAALLPPSPSFAGPPFLSDDPTPTSQHEYEIYAFANGTNARGDREGSYGIDFNYGARPDLQLTATVPVVYEHVGGTVSEGVGNIELAAKMRFLHEESFGWDVSFFPRIFLPSSSELGEDHASLLLPIWVGRSGERWSMFGGGGCAINRGGESQDFCLTGWAVTWAASHDFTFGGELFHQTADVEGGANSTTMGLGATYDLSAQVHWLGYAGAGLQNIDENGRATFYTSLLFTF
jgi:hypothetical protein